MTAKEMFNRWEFEKINTDDKNIIQYKRVGYYFQDIIVFYLQTKTFETYSLKVEVSTNRIINASFHIDTNLYKAITQQMKELGWLE